MAKFRDFTIDFMVLFLGMYIADNLGIEVFSLKGILSLFVLLSVVETIRLVVKNKRNKSQ